MWVRCRCWHVSQKKHVGGKGCWRDAFTPRRVSPPPPRFHPRSPACTRSPSRPGRRGCRRVRPRPRRERTLSRLPPSPLFVSLFFFPNVPLLAKSASACVARRRAGRSSAAGPASARVLMVATMRATWGGREDRVEKRAGQAGLETKKTRVRPSLCLVFSLAHLLRRRLRVVGFGQRAVQLALGAFGAGARVRRHSACVLKMRGKRAQKGPEERGRALGLGVCGTETAASHPGLQRRAGGAGAKGGDESRFFLGEVARRATRVRGEARGPGGRGWRVSAHAGAQMPVATRGGVRRGARVCGAEGEKQNASV